MSESGSEKISARSTLVYGTGNYIEGGGSLVVGSNCRCRHKDCVLLGFDLESTKDGQIIIGSGPDNVVVVEAPDLSIRFRENFKEVLFRDAVVGGEPDELLSGWFASREYKSVTETGACLEAYLHSKFREFAGRAVWDPEYQDHLLPSEWGRVLFWKPSSDGTGVRDWACGYMDPAVWDGKTITGSDSKEWEVSV